MGIIWRLRIGSWEEWEVHKRKLRRILRLRTGS
jgi:hypothetical protein